MVGVLIGMYRHSATVVRTTGELLENLEAQGWEIDITPYDG